ncbi:MAG: DUF2868 domain-containing protein [Burkholderiaceae bacterium]|nr:DUF2868 domain-containing protein [Burkholderiaceae bacterium]
MTENDARNALLVRAFETALPRPAAWSAEDSDWASRAAAEVEGERASAAAFVARRARLAVERLSAADARVHRTLRAIGWRPWIAWALVLAAFALGAAGDAIGARHRINVLAPPLLALMAWNLTVYAAIAVRVLVSLARRKPPRHGPIARLVARAAHVAQAQPGAGADASPLARFALDWARASAKLNATRVARVLHAGAIAFALGALCGMYVRGLGLEFRAGWESTFLDAPTVQALLALVLGPASALTGIALPDAARLEAMRFPASMGEPAAGWIHLYAVTVALVVVLPRLLLAVIDRLREQRLATRFPLSLDDAYFTSLVRAHRGEAATVVAVAHAQAPSPQAALGLRAMLVAVLGAKTALTVARPVGYGDEETAASVLARAAASTQAPTLVVALFASTATPEAQAQGAFVDALSAALPAGARLLALVDESAFVARFGSADPVAVRRRQERCSTWSGFLAERGHPPLILDLAQHDPARAARALREALDRLAGAVPAQAVR